MSSLTELKRINNTINVIYDRPQNNKLNFSTSPIFKPIFCICSGVLNNRYTFKTFIEKLNKCFIVYEPTFQSVNQKVFAIINYLLSRQDVKYFDEETTIIYNFTAECIFNMRYDALNNIRLLNEPIIVLNEFIKMFNQSGRRLTIMD